MLAMLCLSAVSGLIVAGRPGTRATDLRFWLYAEAHADAYRQRLPAFFEVTGKSVSLDLIPEQSLNTRLVSLFMAGRSGGDAPDLVELEIADVGKYFRPPVNDVGLLPLNNYLAHSRVLDRIVRNRLAPWTKQGVVFGVPLDVHPVTLTYRKDLWDEAGIDPQWVAGEDGQPRRPTWPEFQTLCLDFQRFWERRGVRNRHALELFESQPDMLACLLLQRRVNVIDEDGVLHLTDAKTVQTVAFYAQMVAGPRRVAAESAGGAGPWANDITRGNICAFLTPDWRLSDLRHYAPELAGKLRMMPLPRFETTGAAGQPIPDTNDAPTSTWGGTMIGITRSSKHPDDAWKLIEFLIFSDAGLEARARSTDNLPPLRDDWDKPVFHAPDAFFGGQKPFELYISLADQVPSRYETWSSTLGRYGLGYALSRAADYLKAGSPPAGLEDYVATQLKRVDAYVRRCIEHGTF